MRFPLTPKNQQLMLSPNGTTETSARMRPSAPPERHKEKHNGTEAWTQEADSEGRPSGHVPQGQKARRQAWTEARREKALNGEFPHCRNAGTSSRRSRSPTGWRLSSRWLSRHQARHARTVDPGLSAAVSAGPAGHQDDARRSTDGAGIGFGKFLSATAPSSTPVILRL